jgi:hypothetical protein
VRYQKEGLRDSVSTTPITLDQQIECSHLIQTPVLQRLTVPDEAMGVANKRLVLYLDANENIFRAELG